MNFDEYKQAKIHLANCLEAVKNKNPNQIQMQVIDRLKEMIKEYEERKLH